MDVNANHNSRAVYQQAKQLLDSSLPDRIVSRDDEITQLKTFFKSTVTAKKPGSLYISGKPGTGKTSILTDTVAALSTKQKKVIFINCLSSRNSQEIFKRIWCELNGKETAPSLKETVAALEDSFTSRGSPVVLILDEMDSLSSKNQEVLYTVFEWPHLPKSRLVLIGVGNTLDLTERILPRLQARPEAIPQLLQFVPYTKDQIAEVLQNRLAPLEAEGVQVVNRMAVELCARKVSAATGDMRRALDICRGAVELAEKEAIKQQATSGISKDVLRQVTAAHILRITSAIDQGSLQGLTQPDSIPIQQKLALSALLLMVKNQKSKVVTLGKLHEQYKKVCSHQQLTALDQTEFFSTCSLAESQALINIKKGKDTRSTKVSFKVAEQELEHILQDQALMGAILKMNLS